MQGDKNYQMKQEKQLKRGRFGWGTVTRLARKEKKKKVI